MSVKHVLSWRAAYSVISLCVAIAFPIASWSEMDRDEQKTIRQLYADFSETWCNEKKMSKFFTETLATDTAKACDTGLIGMEVGVPIIPGQEYDEKEIMRTLKVNCGKQAKPTCTAIFENFGASNTVKYQLIEQSGDWLIADIIDEQGFSYRKSLSEALK
jgi:hypothetical protein